MNSFLAAVMITFLYYLYMLMMTYELFDIKFIFLQTPSHGNGLSKSYLYCKRRWFSGRMLACHAGDPGSIPGRRIALSVSFCEQKYKKISCFNVAICFCKIDLKAELRLIELIQVNDTGKEMVLHLGRGNSLN
ncbi:hypothetical protein T4A_831 [Trichinella pseudospiralis]|uniref:Uncharacterized protein n=1 Tax=Trichinella pseudospiralis TaxID=6337 RepID=A0A0V1EUV0_TRIPS|nr:hypothetical protein T4A_831 [Trichinella pseudospiralis]